MGPDRIDDAEVHEDQDVHDELSQWLALPGEQGKPPDRMELRDRRTLTWPVVDKKVPFWVIQWWAGHEEGRPWKEYTQVAVIRPSFLEDTIFRSIRSYWYTWQINAPPEDLYAYQLCEELLEESALTIDDSPCGTVPAEPLLAKAEASGAIHLRRVMTATVRLKNETPLHADLLIGKVGEVSGFLVVGPHQTQFYDPSHFAEDLYFANFLKIHIGRSLLGFPVDVEREMPRDPRLAVPSHVIVREWQETERTIRRRPKIRNREPLTPAHRPLSAVELLTYAHALKDTGKEELLLPTLEYLEQEWPMLSYASGRDDLGRAAYICGFKPQAERLLTVVRNESRFFYRDKTMHPLVRIYFGSDRKKEAKKLLRDCLLASLKYAMRIEGVSRINAEAEYQAHRKLYLELFPEEAPHELLNQLLPATTYPEK